MKPPQFVQLNRGGTVAIDLLQRPASTYTVSAWDSDGASIFAAQAATLGTANTTLTAQAAAGATSLAVAANTGLTKGGRYWLRNPDEEVLLQSTPSALTLTLQRPLRYLHISGSVLHSTRLTYAVAAANATKSFWRGQLEWLIDAGLGTEETHHQELVCSLYNLRRPASVQEWLDEEPKLYDLFDVESDGERQLDHVWAMVIERIAAQVENEAWSYTGPHRFARALIFGAQTWLYRRQAGDAATVLYERYQTAYTQALDEAFAAASRDADQDRSPEPHEQVAGRSGRLLRA